jgi:hypothetical protein
MLARVPALTAGRSGRRAHLSPRSTLAPTCPRGDLSFITRGQMQPALTTCNKGVLMATQMQASAGGHLLRLDNRNAHLLAKVCEQAYTAA